MKLHGTESWQPLTPDTDLIPPDWGCLALYHKYGNIHVPSKEDDTWIVPEGNRVALFYDVSDLRQAGYTHYRVLRGPEGM